LPTLRATAALLKGHEPRGLCQELGSELRAEDLPVWFDCGKCCRCWLLPNPRLFLHLERLRYAESTRVISTQSTSRLRPVADTLPLNIGRCFTLTQAREFAGWHVSAASLGSTA
jgi:hypothetical protein